jgi:hypothetical protein
MAVMAAGVLLLPRRAPTQIPHSILPGLDKINHMVFIM